MHGANVATTDYSYLVASLHLSRLDDSIGGLVWLDRQLLLCVTWQSRYGLRLIFHDIPRS